jgi:hypothetical protein
MISKRVGKAARRLKWQPTYLLAVGPPSLLTRSCQWARSSFIYTPRLCLWETAADDGGAQIPRKLKAGTGHVLPRVLARADTMFSSSRLSRRGKHIILKRCSHSDANECNLSIITMAPLLDPTAVLPTELFDQIFAYLSLPAPSASRLREPPNEPLITKSDDTPLKHASLVNQRWRAVSLPLLYKHLVWQLKPTEVAATRMAPIEEPSAPKFDLVETYRPRKEGGTLGHASFDELLEMSLLRPPKHDLLAFLKAHELGSYVESIFIKVHGYGGQHLAEHGRQLWRRLFDAVNPLRLTVMASPAMLGQLVHGRVAYGSFKVSWQILSVSRPTRDLPPPSESDTSAIESAHAVAALKHASTTTDAQSENHSAEEPHKTSTASPLNELFDAPTESFLLTVRPWTTLLLNEGSFIPAYATEHTHHHQIPSSLVPLFGAKGFHDTTSLIPSSIRDFSYIATFPFASHINSLILHLPPLDKLYVQLASRRDTAYGQSWREAFQMREGDRYGHVDEDDLLRERNMSYGLIMSTMLDRAAITAAWAAHEANMEGGREYAAILRERRNNWRHLKEFESGDTDDLEAWEIAVEYVRLSGSRWTAARRGVFVQRDGEEGSEAEGNEVDDGDFLGETLGWDDDVMDEETVMQLIADL